MRYFRVRNHDRFQHYKNRNPPWIMLHLRLFGSQRFMELTDAQRWQALALALIASRYDNHLPDNPKWLREETHSQGPINLEPLLAAKFLVWCNCEECASNLQQAAADCCSEESIGEHRRGEDIHVDPTSGSTGGVVSRVWERHLRARVAYYKRENGSAPGATPTLTPELRKAITRAVKVHGEDKATDAGIGIFLSGYHTGDNEDRRKYLGAHLVWRMTAKLDNVETFAGLVAEARGRKR